MPTIEIDAEKLKTLLDAVLKFGESLPDYESPDSVIEDLLQAANALAPKPEMPERVFVSASMIEKATNHWIDPLYPHIPQSSNAVEYIRRDLSAIPVKDGKGDGPKYIQTAHDQLQFSTQKKSG